MMNTKHRPAEAKAVRVDQQTRTAQQRLADKPFSDFMRQHNRAIRKEADDDEEPTSDPEAEDYGKYLDQQFWGDH